MGKLLIGHYGTPPSAESRIISLQECHQKLGLKPSDYIAADEPDIFRKSHGAHGKYLVLQISAEEVESNVMWKPGYYLLPLEAIDVLSAFDGRRNIPGGQKMKPVSIEKKEDPPPLIMERANAWAQKSQPLFFECKCDYLEMKLDAPWGLRRRWRARLMCPKRCQPTLKSEL